MIQFKALIIKELKEAFRDKRALMVAMIMAFLTPVMIFSMSKMMIRESVETPPVYVKMNGAQYAPKLIQAFAKENILLFADVPDAEKTLWDKRNITINIPETFNDDMRAGKTINITLRADYSDKALSRPIQRIRDVVQGYAQAIAYNRLLMRGIDVRLLQPVKLMEQDTAVPNRSPLVISMLLSMYLLMVAFMSGLSVSIDSSAGERERHVLELLLSQPVSTLKIVLAKLSCSSLVSIIGISLTLILTVVALEFVDLSKIGANFDLSAGIIVVLFILLLPVCFLAAALQLFVSFHSKSFKEAQSTVSMIILLPAISPLILMFIDDRPQWLTWLPVFGHSLMMENLFKGVAVNWATLPFVGCVTLVLAAVLVLLTAKKLKSEKVVLTLS